VEVKGVDFAGWDKLRQVGELHLGVEWKCVVCAGCSVLTVGKNQILLQTKEISSGSICKRQCSSCKGKS
jgi:hypothetical protein